MATEQGQGLLSRLLTAWVAGVCKRPWLVLICSLLVGGLSVYFACSRLEYRTQRNDLISPTKDYYKRWQQFVAEFGDDDDMVVVLQGTDKDKMKSALEELAGLVQKQPDKFDRLFYKVDLTPLHNRALLFLPADQIRLIQDNLKNMGLLLDAPVISTLDPLFSWKSLTLEQLLHEGERRVAALQADPADKAGNADFLSQLDAICRTAAGFLDDPKSYKNPWQSIIHQPPGQEDRMAEAQYFFGGQLAFLLVHPIRENSFTGTNKSVSALRAILAQVQPRYPGLQFGLTGQPVLENDEMMTSQKDSNTATWLAIIGIALLYMLAYRSWRFPVFTVATLLVGTAWSLGWLTLTVGHLNILSASFVVMLIGIGDYGVLWITRYGQERERGADLETAMRICAGSVGRGILTAGLTTALAFFATMLADFKAVEELGWIAGCGVFLCALACFIVLPALVTLWDRRGTRERRSAPPVLSLAEIKNQRRQWLPFLMRRPRLVVGVSLGLALVLAFCARGTRYDHNLLHMQARGLDSVRWEETLIDNTAGASWHALTYTTTPEEALALKTRFEKLPTVSMVVEAASLVPRDQERKLEQLKDIQFRLRRLPKRGVVIPHALPNMGKITRGLRRLFWNMVEIYPAGLVPPDLPKYPDAYGALRKSLETLEDKLRTISPDLAAQKLKSFEEALTGDLAEDLHKLRDVSTPASISIADLPAGFRERYIGKTGKWLVSVFAKESLWDYEPLAAFIKQVQTVDPDITGKPITTLEGLRSMKEGFILAAVYAFIVIVVVLLFDFQSWKFTLLALAPLVMGLCAAAGIMTLLHIPFNPANMIVVPLIIGVGTDNGVHVLHDFRSRRGGVYTLTRATGQGIMVKALATVLGFGTLMISNHRGIYSLGLALTLGVTCCMLTALVFLPALLRLKSAREQAAQKHVRKVA
jgi:hopanoid biosynthesis associated RND transporter like protein HpnN